MATRIWLDTDGNWTNTANWSGGSVPTGSDDVYILEGDQTIDTNLPGSTAGVNYASLTIGPNFEGQLGTSSTPLYIGTVALVSFRGDLCKGCYIYVDSGDSITNLVIDGTSAYPDAFVLKGGTATNMLVKSSQVCKVEANATLTSLRVVAPDRAGASAPNMTIAGSATVTTAYISAGLVNNNAAAGTIYQSGGIWSHVGGSTYNVTALHMLGGTFRFFSQGGTITTAYVLGGTLDGDGGRGTARTVTTLNQYGGVLNRRGLGGTVTVGTTNRFGGVEAV